MIIELKNHQEFLLRKLVLKDLARLVNYLDQLSFETKSRFGPHPFDTNSIVGFYENPGHTGYIAEDPETSTIIAYSIIKIGYLEHDSSRLQSYGLVLNNDTDCTFAPSIADQWQSLGLGNSLFQFILDEIKNRQIRRIILWGGVQANNIKAVNYYKRNGFRLIGKFQHNGENYDIIFEV